MTSMESLNIYFAIATLILSRKAMFFYIDIIFIHINRCVFMHIKITWYNILINLTNFVNIVSPLATSVNAYRDDSRKQRVKFRSAFNDICLFSALRYFREIIIRQYDVYERNIA